ncbi:MAG: hypothetical protein WC360_08500 [Opitutales bacterium]|jgi:hypothetical protein
MPFPIYIQADLADFDSPLDIRRNDTPAFWSGTDLQFNLGIFQFGVLRDVSDLASLTLEIKPTGSRGERPDPTAAPLMSKTVTSFDNSLSEGEWYGFTHAHASVIFTAGESCIPAGMHWLVVTAVTKHNPSQSLTLCAGAIDVQQDGYDTAEQVQASGSTAYSKAEADARFARLRQDGAVLYVDSTGGDDAIGARGRADLPFATLAAAFAAASAGDCVRVLPGSYAAVTLSAALRLFFEAGSVLDGPLTLAVDGASAGGVLGTAAGAACGISAASARSLNIDGVLGLDKPLHPNVRASGGIVVDRSAASLPDSGLYFETQPGALSGRRYFGGYSSLPASAARSGLCRYGASVVAQLCATGAGTLADLGNLKIELTDADSASARVQVSLALSTGTLVVRTAWRVFALGAWRSLAVVTDAPDGGGYLSAASVRIYVDGAAQTLETVAAFTGTPAATSAAWYLSAASSGANTLAACIASDGFRVLDYALSETQWAAFLRAQRLPFEGAGTMQTLVNGGFEIFTGTADDGVTDSFPGWVNQLGPGSAEAVADGGGYACKITNGASSTSTVYTYLGVSGCRLVISTKCKGDGTNAGSWNVYSNTLGAYIPDTAGVTAASTGNTSTAWAYISRTFDIPASVTDARLILSPKLGTPGASSYWDDMQVRVTGNLLAGLDLSAQPVCSRAADGSVLLDSEVGVDLWPVRRPERMVLATQAAMSADGYLLGDRAVHPAGYVVDKVLVTNAGTASATVTIRANTSSGTVIATGTVAATGLPLTLAVGSISALTAAGGKVWVGGGAAAAPLTLAIVLNRCP